MTSPTAWSPGPHEAIERLEDNLWTVAGDSPGSPLRKRMTVWKTNDGRVAAHSVIMLSDAAQRELEALGPLAYIVVPNGFHRAHAPAYKARYPDARVLCAEACRARVAKVVPVDGTFDALQDAAVSCIPVRGVGQGEHVFVIRSGARSTLLFNDTLFNHPHVAGFKGALLRWLGSSGGPRVTPFARLALVKDKPALRAHLEELAAMPGLARIVVSHVDLIREDPAGVLRGIAATL
jgi:hypothetical protein